MIHSRALPTILTIAIAIPLTSLPREADAFSESEKKALSAEIETALKRDVLEVWYPRCLDTEHGGFLSDFDYRWRATGPHDKMMPFQARHTWVAAKAMELYPRDPRYAAAARHGFKCLKEIMWDAREGGWFWRLTRRGEAPGNERLAKHAYGISFGIYACAAYHIATKDAEAVELARDAVQWLDRHGHDDEHGGYFEFFEPDGARIMAGPPDRDLMGNPVGYKTMNSHIHLLEAFTELYRARPDPDIRKRLEELFLIVRDHVTVPPGAMHLYFNADWVPAPDHDSYGHDVETGFLLTEAAEALGNSDERSRVVPRMLVDHALQYGWDKERGGFFYGGSTFGEIFLRDKSWWVQAEGMNALLLMARLYPNDAEFYEKKFLEQWEYIKRYMLDRKYGEWHASGLDSNPDRTQAKATVWKASYHNSRALMNCLGMLRAE